MYCEEIYIYININVSLVIGPAQTEQQYDVEVPEGVLPGKNFRVQLGLVTDNGGTTHDMPTDTPPQQVTVECPNHCTTGAKLRISGKILTFTPLP
jgi:hypothetical protein